MNVIIVFTKDRPDTLSETLDSIDKIQYPKYVIDNSVNQKNQERTLILCKKNNDCQYLGKQEFKTFVAEFKIDLNKYNFLLQEPGNTEWNLGYARNFALLFSNFIKAENVLFMDDDIIVSNIGLIDQLFVQLNKYPIVGAHILGLVDDSILGHIATSLGIFNERMLSGGFMAFKLSEINYHFLNNYNEDWIWLFLHLKNNNYLQTGEVFQAISDPLFNYKTKVIFQEFGEIALDGLLNLFHNDSYENLVGLEFWQTMVNERKEYLTKLQNIAKSKMKVQYIEVIDYVKSNSLNFKAAIFKDLFEQFSSDRVLFQRLYNSFS